MATIATIDYDRLADLLADKMAGKEKGKQYVEEPIECEYEDWEVEQDASLYGDEEEE